MKVFVTTVEGVTVPVEVGDDCNLVDLVQKAGMELGLEKEVVQEHLMLLHGGRKIRFRGPPLPARALGIQDGDMCVAVDWRKRAREENGSDEEERRAIERFVSSGP